MHFQAVRCAGYYDHVLRTAILRFKFNERTSLARPLAELLAHTFGAFFQRGDYDAVVYVPLHRSRLRQRGYDQAMLLSRRLSSLLSLPLWTGAIERVRHTESQAGLSWRQRIDNVRGAFAIPKPRRMAGAQLLLIDDVVTTTSTVNECARAITEAGAERVDVLAVGRSV